MPSRAQLKKVPKLGPKAFEQCAGFLRVHGSRSAGRDGGSSRKLCGGKGADGEAGLCAAGVETRRHRRHSGKGAKQAGMAKLAA